MAAVEKKRKEGGDVMGTLTLRDYFAAKAMQSLITVQFQTKQAQSAETAYEWADAMLKARES
jgi:hypothetical protein